METGILPLRHTTLLLRTVVVLGAVLILVGTPATARAYTFITIDVPGATSTEASGINPRGQIVGHFLDASGADHGFMLLRRTTFITIDVPGATSTEASGINPEAQIVGNFLQIPAVQTTALCCYGGQPSSPSTCRAPRAPRPPGSIRKPRSWVITRMPRVSCMALCCYGGQPSSPSTCPAPRAPRPPGSIRKPRSWVITRMLRVSVHGFVLLRGTTFITIDVPGATSTEASGINPRGQIVGNYTDAAGTLHGFVAMP